MEQPSAYQRALGILIFFTLAAGDFWRYLLSWWGWGALCGLLLVLVIVDLVRFPIALRRVPAPLAVFLVLALASIAWSAYPAETLIATATTTVTVLGGVYLALRFSWDDLRAVLTAALRWIIGLSLAFELLVSVVIRERVLPFWVDWSGLDKIPASFYWSRNLLLDGGRIQGIVGNSNLLGMVAVIALAVFAVGLLTRQGSPIWGWVWLVAAAATVALTRSSTGLAALVAMALTAAYLVIVHRARASRRIVVHIGAAGAAVAVVAVVIALREPLLRLLGKSSDLTYRVDIWEAVLELIEQRPVAGWGWISYWAPWVEPYDGLVEIRGVEYLQAHNAWLDVMLQLGVLGVVAFGAIVLTTAVRSWFVAIGGEEQSWSRALPLVLLAGLLVQSLAESRLLIESGLTLLVILSIVSTWWAQQRAPQRIGAR